MQVTCLRTGYCRTPIGILPGRASQKQPTTCSCAALYEKYCLHHYTACYIGHVTCIYMSLLKDKTMLLTHRCTHKNTNSHIEVVFCAFLFSTSPMVRLFLQSRCLCRFGVWDPWPIRRIGRLGRRLPTDGSQWDSVRTLRKHARKRKAMGENLESPVEGRHDVLPRARSRSKQCKFWRGLGYVS